MGPPLRRRTAGARIDTPPRSVLSHEDPCLTPGASHRRGSRRVSPHLPYGHVGLRGASGTATRTGRTHRKTRTRRSGGRGGRSDVRPMDLQKRPGRSPHRTADERRGPSPHRQHHQDLHRSHGPATRGQGTPFSRCLRGALSARPRPGQRLRRTRHHRAGASPAHQRTARPRRLARRGRHRLAAPQPVHTPGTGETGTETAAPKGTWHYSTTNYILAGLVIEKVTGHSAEKEISRRIIKPLKLHDTYWPGNSEHILGRHSRSYFTTERVDGTEWNTSAGVWAAH